MPEESMRLAADGVSATPFEIPGATGQFRIQILNEDAGRGVVTSIVHLPPGGRIPAHLHRAGSEMHYVLEGDLIEKGESLGVGAFLTHAPGAVHGPHESKNGARVLTVQQWQSRNGSFDFELVEGAEAAAPSGGGSGGGAEPARAGAGAPTGEPAEGGGDSPTAQAQRQEAEQSLGKGYG